MIARRTQAHRLQRPPLPSPALPPHVSSSVIFCEAAAIYGVIVAIILQTKVESVAPMADGSGWPTPAYTAGYAIFASGLTTGSANLACG